MSGRLKLSVLLTAVFIWWSSTASAGAQSAPAVGTARAQAPQEVLQRVATLLTGGDVRGAEAAAAAALERYPHDATLQNLAGVIDAQRGEPKAAEGHFKKAIELAPSAVAPYENLGRLYQEQSADDPSARRKAIDVYRRLLRIAPDHVEALYQSALLHALLGEFADARAHLEWLPEEIRNRPQALAVRVAVLAGSGDAQAARAEAERLGAHPELTAADVLSVLPALERAADVAPAQVLVAALDGRGLASPELLHTLGRLHARLEQLDAARAVLDRAAVAKPSVPVLLDLARVAGRQHDYKGALGYLAHARDLDPENAEVHFLFGMACVELNLGREAHESLQRAVKLAPDNPLVNYAMGAVSLHRHDPSESIPYFERYVELKPDDPRGRFALGAARFYSNQFDRAKADLEQAAKVPETAAGAHYFLARIARQFNDLDGARREVEKALELNPSYPDAWAELGLVQLRQRDYDAAKKSLDKALQIDPDNYAATVNLATLYSRTGDPRREAQAARLAELQQKRAIAAQEFLRIVEVVP